MRRDLFALFVTTALTWTTALSAQELDKQRLDFSVPDIPAFMVLGVAPSRVSRPSNARELVAGLASGFDVQGHVQSGLAVEVAPTKLIGVSSPDVLRWLGGLRASLATDAVASSGDTITRAAFGLRWSVFGYHPEADPYLRRCINAALPKPSPPPAELDESGETPAGSEGFGEEAREIFVEGVVSCRAAFRALHLADTGFEIAYAHAGQSVNDSRLSAMHTMRDAVWLTATWGVNSLRKSEVEVSEGVDVRAWGSMIRTRPWLRAYAFEPALLVGLDLPRVQTSSVGQTDLIVAARLPLLSDGWTVFAEGGYQVSNVGQRVGAGVVRRDKVPLGFGGDVRLGNGTWLGLYAGFADARTSELMALGNLKWSLGESRPLPPK